MFSKLSILAAAALLTLAAAIPNNPPPPVTPPTSIQCCERVVPSTNEDAVRIADLVGLDLSGILVDVGLACNDFLLPNDCAGTNFLCDAPEEQWGGLIAINCIPITP
ncbi:hypothetical protein C8R44DRAFT_788002 [Mycena epipterygia]|nr:hypothetical protein C8R44DRAFT_788002 [Mycena epipterygia]